MVLKHFEPEVDYSWEQLNEITGKRPGFYTWPTRAFLWMKRRGYEIQSIDSVDFGRLVKEGRSYFSAYYGEEVATKQIAMCDFDAEMRLLEQYLTEVETPAVREPTMQDVRLMHRNGFVPIVNLNSFALNQRPGYEGHFVILLGSDMRRVQMHDPGLPAKPSRAEKHAVFEKAWAYPDKKAKGLVGVRRQPDVSK